MDLRAPRGPKARVDPNRPSEEDTWWRILKSRDLALYRIGCISSREHSKVGIPNKISIIGQARTRGEHI
jgi:hypothetical protein